MRLPKITAFVYYSELGMWVWGLGFMKNRIHKSLFTNAVLVNDRICK